MRLILIFSLAFLGCGSRTELVVANNTGQGPPSEDDAAGGDSSDAGSSSVCYDSLDRQLVATEDCPACPVDRPVPCCVFEVVDLPDGAQDPTGVCNCCVAQLHRDQ